MTAECLVLSHPRTCEEATHLVVSRILGYKGHPTGVGHNETPRDHFAVPRRTSGSTSGTEEIRGTPPEARSGIVRGLSSCSPYVEPSRPRGQGKGRKGHPTPGAHGRGAVNPRPRPTSTIADPAAPGQFFLRGCIQHVPHDRQLFRIVAASVCSVRAVAAITPSALPDTA